MNPSPREATTWIYEGLWGVLTQWLRVQRTPPSLPVREGEKLTAFRPSPGYLQYAMIAFWLGMAFNVIIAIICLVALIAAPLVGIVLLPVFLLFVLVPSLLAYLAIHVRYDTMWYVLSDRSLRIRHGVWIISEMTFTFENIQNVSVSQGPLQRVFGIADVVVDTAGGGGGGQGQQGAQMAVTHRGLITGVDNANEIRDVIMSRMRASTGAGLGDDHAHARTAWGAGFGPAHIAALREIRDLLR